MNAIEELAVKQGFECMGTCDAKKLVARPEVRAMCSVDKCRVYGRSWACPPVCGDIEDFERLMHEFDHCLVVQTIAELEDEFDIETMGEASERAKERVLNLTRALADAGLGDKTKTFTAGTCTLCETCTYPDAPCRFPDKQLVSMEAAGLVVSEVCTMAGIPYNHGPQTIAYSGCVLY